MQDTVIKGTGNSRTLKGPPNLLAMYPTWEAAAQAIQDGTFPIDLGPLNDQGVLTHGTDLVKENLLTDALCTALGLPTTATPADALEKLRQGVNNGVKVVSGSYKGTGTYGQDNPNSLTFSFKPKILFIAGKACTYKNYTNDGIAVVVISNSIFFPYFLFVPPNGGNHFSENAILSRGETVSWYQTKTNNMESNDRAAAQFNVSGSYYKYVAIG